MIGLSLEKSGIHLSYLVGVLLCGFKGDHNLQDYSCGKLPPIVVIVLVLIQMTAVSTEGIEPPHPML